MPDTPTTEVIHRYDETGPRNTSHPTAVMFSDAVGCETYAKHLDSASRTPDEPLSLYLHLPFFRERCWYCGCNVVITPAAVEVTPLGRRLVRNVAMRFDAHLDRSRRAGARFSRTV